MRRFVVSGGLLLLAAPACLLYTDPINTAPKVTMTAPATVFPYQNDTYRAQGSDPDGDSVTIEWYAAEGKCKDISDAAWADQAPSIGETFVFQPANHNPFCVRVLARDQHGAPSQARTYDGTPQNRAPMPVLGVDPPLGMTSQPLYTTFRVTAGPLVDADGDRLEFTWKVLDPQGADATARLAKCDPQHDEVRCLLADQPGMYTVSIDATDHIAPPMSRSVALPVLEDAAPCIEATDPVQDAQVVVLAVTDRRNFEVRRVRDDGNPFPAGPRGGTSFQWFSMREGGASWTRHLGFDRPLFEVSAALFEDARPGSSYRVRVEARDPQHDTGNDLQSCKDDPICMVPDKCVRWVTWSVRFQ